MNNFIKLADGLDVSRVQHQLKLNEHLWVNIGHNVADPDGPGYPHRDAHSITLRLCKVLPDYKTNIASQKAMEDDIISFNQPQWHVFSELKKLLYPLVEIVGGTFIGRIVIIGLDAGKTIESHFDKGFTTDFYQRYHIVINGPKDCLFICGQDEDQEQVEMETGSIWWFDSHKQHSVVNNGTERRISVACDIASL